MPNPWLNIPLADYEGHMGSAGVRQLDLLTELFGVVLELCHPASVAVLGVAGGNGLDRIDTKVTRRVVRLDVNPLYLAEVRTRYGQKYNLELHCVDLREERIALEPVHLVHAALVFEHAGVDLCLENAVSLVTDGGAISVVLQLPAEAEHGVSASEFASMQKLRSHFSFVDPSWLRIELTNRRFHLIQEAESCAAGKRFWMGIFRRISQVAT